MLRIDSRGERHHHPWIQQWELVVTVSISDVQNVGLIPDPRGWGSSYNIKFNVFRWEQPGASLGAEGVYNIWCSPGSWTVLWCMAPEMSLGVLQGSLMVYEPFEDLTDPSHTSQHSWVSYVTPEGMNTFRPMCEYEFLDIFVREV